MLHNSKHHIRRAKPLLGTIVEISLFSDLVNKETLLSYSEQAFACIRKVQALMSFFDSNSEVSFLNRSLPGEQIDLSPETFTVLKAAEQMYKLSQGAFDILCHSRKQYPNASLVLSENCAIKSDPFLVDLGGIAKGYAVDHAASLLITSGISGIINAGGDIKFFGELSFPLTIRAPNFDGNNIEVGTFKNCSVATSAFDLNTDSICSISVIADRCMIADALTKALAHSHKATHKRLLDFYDADYFELPNNQNKHLEEGLG
ncbi:MAG: FAD:protein FMN transferase [Deltaproteobacteria bacterium]|nr:FAD:protein FMN transferase [Deltaproteobacteria bacterium]